MSSTVERPLLGCLLAVTTAILWGVLPIALKEALGAMDVYTITFYRFAGAALLLTLWLGPRRQLPNPLGAGLGIPLMLLLCALGLAGNYGLYLQGLDHLEPKTAQVVIQLAPFLLLVAGVVLLKEGFSLRQWLGAAMLVSGLLLFFNERLLELVGSVGDYGVGVWLVVIAALAWVVYALVQKRLLSRFSSPQLMWLLYALGSLMFLPAASLEQLLGMNLLQLLALLFCCLNTLVAYGCFAESLNHWAASKVSAVLATAPLFTIVAVDLLVLWFPDHVQDVAMGWLAYVGATLVVLGSVLATVGRRR